MRVDTTRYVNIVLTLTEEEALWLKGVMQNPINTDMEQESERDYKMRSAYWDVLKGVVNVLD